MIIYHIIDIETHDILESIDITDLIVNKRFENKTSINPMLFIEILDEEIKKCNNLDEEIKSEIDVLSLPHVLKDMYVMERRVSTLLNTIKMKINEEKRIDKIKGIQHKLVDYIMTNDHKYDGLVIKTCN